MSAPTAPSPRFNRTSSAGQVIYAVRSWEGDEEDINLYTTLRGAKYGASNAALDMCEANDPELFNELEKIHDPDEVLYLFDENVTNSQGWGGVSIVPTVAPR